MNSKITYTTNFKNLLFGRSFLNIADSFYAVTIAIGLISVYNIDVANLSFFALLSILPRTFSVFYGVYLERIVDKRKYLVFFQILQVILILLIMATLYFKLSIYYIYILNVLFHFVNTIHSSLQAAIIPETLDYDENLINKSVDIQYFTSNTLDIISNFIASLLLGFVTYLVVLEISIPFFVVAIYFFYKISKSKTTTPNYEDEEQIEESYNEGLKNIISHFLSSKYASSIIIVESFLSGMTDMLLKLTPLYLIYINVDIKYIGLVLATHRLADFLGALVAPLVKIEISKFFCLDYIISGALFVAIFTVDNHYIKLLCYFLAFIIIGISGNFFEKMIYEYYDMDKLAGLHTVITTLFSVFGIVFLIIPIFYSNITVLGITFNIITILCGVFVLFIQTLDKKKTT